MILQPPQLALGSAPELGRVEQDAVVAPPAPDLAGGELGGIVDQPADRPVGQPRQSRIGLAALDRFFRRVDMDQPPAGLAEQQAADPRVAEQIEDVGVGGPGPHPVPLRRHVGEETEMAEGRQRGVEANIAARQRPAIRDWSVLHPSPAAFFVGAGDEGSVRLPIVAGRRPHRLRLGPDDRERAVALELAAMPAVNQAPVVPWLGDQGRQLAHAARAAGTPIVARAQGPAIIRSPASRTSSRVTASSASTTSAGSTSRPWTESWRAT